MIGPSPVLLAVGGEIVGIEISRVEIERLQDRRGECWEGNERSTCLGKRRSRKVTREKKRNLGVQSDLTQSQLGVSGTYKSRYYAESAAQVRKY